MKYIKPELKICLFSAEDIITASGEIPETAAADVFAAAGYNLSYTQMVDVSTKE